MPSWQDGEIANCNQESDELWWIHNKRKQDLANFVAEKTGFGYDPNRLVISWARRIASYKRPDALFADLDRLATLIKNQDRPVQILMAGKAHASDDGAKSLLQQLITFMKTDLAGHAIYVPNYNIDVANKLVRGSDVWINTPVLGMEASGTSGMKAIANGVLQLTAEDGWAAEVEWDGIGFKLDGNDISNSMYFRLEEDVVPMFYHRDENGVPQDWLKLMRKSIELSKQYSATRMMNDYKEKLYTQS
jgi:alpha-glucan phosphorylase-like protein